MKQFTPRVRRFRDAMFHLLYSNLCVMRERAEQMEEIRERQVEKRREVEGRARDEKSNRKGKETDN